MANANTMTKISTVTVGSGGAATIEFTSIPATYTDIVIKYSGRSTAAGNYQNVNIKINTDTGSNYTSKLLYGDGSAAGSDTTTTTFLKFMYIPFSSATASVFSNGELYFAKYAGSIYKSMIADTVTENNATGSGSSIIGLTAGLWSDNSAINAITLTPNSGNWAEYSTASLYGISATTATTALATGGTITYNGGYVYHTFLNSGTFTPAQSLITDCLVIGAGGAGGPNGRGGGAGGELLYNGSVSMTASAYTCTVGAGSAWTANNGRNGSSSVLSGASITTITATAGEDSGDPNGGVGRNNGASGGNYASTGTSGGTGVSAYSSWGYATTTGQLVSGTYYYAGGGGGGSNTANNATGGSGGGGRGGAVFATPLPATAGTVNTGGGGGGMGNGETSTTTSGGKGIIIIRYQVQ